MLCWLHCIIETIRVTGRCK